MSKETVRGKSNTYVSNHTTIEVLRGGKLVGSLVLNNSSIDYYKKHARKPTKKITYYNLINMLSKEEE